LKAHNIIMILCDVRLVSKDTLVDFLYFREFFW